MTTTPQQLLPRAGQLRSRLLAAGYTVDGIDALLGAEASAALARGDLVPALHVATGDSELERLIRLFLLGRCEPLHTLTFLPEAALEPVADGQVRAALDIRPHQDEWYVASDIARTHPPAPDHVIGIGAASLTLVAATLRRPVGTALDIGTGCGIQALHLSAHAAQVTATDAVPRAVDMAALTFALSGFRPGGIELLSGDFFAPVTRRRFDLVVANPPFVLAPPDPDALLYRDAASSDGALGRLLSDAVAVLEPGGVAQVLTSWVIPAGGSWQEHPAELVPPGCDALVVLREVLDPAQHVALWRDEEEPEPAATERALRWLAHVHDLGAEGIAYGLVVLRRTDAAPRVSFLDLTSEPAMVSGSRIGGWLDRIEARQAAAESLRLRATEGLRLAEESVLGADGWEPVTRRLTAPSALPDTVGIDPVTQALLAGCDGRLPLGAVAELLAVATGAPAEGVLRAALRAVRDGAPGTRRPLAEPGEWRVQGVRPHSNSVAAPGSSTTRLSPDASALAGLVIGSIATPRRFTSAGSVSPVKTCR